MFQSAGRAQTVTAEEMRDHQVSDFDDSNIGDDHRMIQRAAKPSIQEEWIILSVAIDRISFIFYGFIFALLAIVYSV